MLLRLSCFLFLLIIASAEPAFAQRDTLIRKSFPDQRGWVNDFEGDLDSATTDTLIRLAIEHQQKTSNQICIVTIARPREDLADYAQDLANRWGIGKKGKDNGVVIVMSKASRKVRIATGLGLEEKLTDAMCKHVIDDKMIPKFRDGEYGRGLIDGVREIITLLEKNKD